MKNVSLSALISLCVLSPVYAMNTAMPSHYVNAPTRQAIPAPIVWEVHFSHQTAQENKALRKELTQNYNFLTLKPGTVNRNKTVTITIRPDTDDKTKIFHNNFKLDRASMDAVIFPIPKGINSTRVTITVDNKEFKYLVNPELNETRSINDNGLTAPE